MIENHNPESGIDQFLANQAEPTIEELKGKVARLESELNRTKLIRDSYGTKIDKLRDYIQASIDREEWTDEELGEIFWEELAEMLDLEISKTVEIVIKAEWTATVKMKRSQEVDDLELSVKEPYGYGVELSDVWERDFDISEQ